MIKSIVGAYETSSTSVVIHYSVLFLEKIKNFSSLITSRFFMHGDIVLFYTKVLPALHALMNGVHGFPLYDLKHFARRKGVKELDTGN